MRIVIIGAGPAGVTVVETLRQHGSEAEIVMLTDEPYPPYSPPAMVTYFETGEPFHFWRGQDFAERLGVDYRPGSRVVGVTPGEHAVRLASGEPLAYDKLVVASGGRLYAPLEGSDKPGVYNFKSLTAAEELLGRVKAGKAKTALIVGAGFIGVEIGLLLADLGLAVTLVEMSDRVMPRSLDAEASGIVLEAMRERGIDVRLNAEALAFRGKPRTGAVELASGARLAADLLVVATGLRPNVEFLAGSGLKIGRGVLVDEYQRTNLPDVYACGDVAETLDRLTGERYVHAIFPNAIEQGRVAACNLLGLDVAYEGADNMNSLKHLGLPIMAVGHMEGEELRRRRDGALRKVWLKEGRIVGFCLVGDVSAAGIYRSLMNRREDVSAFRERLLEPGFGMGTVENLALAPGVGG